MMDPIQVMGSDLSLFCRIMPPYRELMFEVAERR